MENKLTENTLKKLQKEINNDECIEEKLNKIRKTEWVFCTKKEYIQMLEKIRSYRKRVFDLKAQIGDLNKAYDKITITDFFQGYNEDIQLYENNLEIDRYDSNTEEKVTEAQKKDYIRFVYFIFIYYEKIIRQLEMALLMEKSENYNNKASASDEDFIELQ